MIKPKAKKKAGALVVYKVCSNCGQKKPLSEFHKYTGKTARSPDGHRAMCKVCRNAIEVARNLAKREAAQNE